MGEQIRPEDIQAFVYGPEFLSALSAMTRIPFLFGHGGGTVSKVDGARCTPRVSVGQVLFDHAQTDFDVHSLSLVCSESDASPSYEVHTSSGVVPFNFFPVEVSFTANVRLNAYPPSTDTGCSGDVVGNGKACAGINLGNINISGDF